MVNVAQSFLILHFSINCMLPLVTLGFPCLILSKSQFLVKVFAILGSTQLNLAYFSVNSSVIFTLLILGLHSLKSD